MPEAPFPGFVHPTVTITTSRIRVTCVRNRHQVECFPQFCSKENPAKHPPVKAGRYLLSKYSQTHQDFDGNQQQRGDKSA